MNNRITDDQLAFVHTVHICLRTLNNRMAQAIEKADRNIEGLERAVESASSHPGQGNR